MSVSKIKNERQRFERYLNGIAQNEYPQDTLDEVIYNSIKNKYPSAKIISSTLVTNVELADLRRLITKGYSECTIQGEPELDYTKIVYPKLKTNYRFLIHLYPSNPKDIQYCGSGTTFYKNVPLDEWDDMRKELKKLNVTLHTPEEATLSNK